MSGSSVRRSRLIVRLISTAGVIAAALPGCTEPERLHGVKITRISLPGPTDTTPAEFPGLHNVVTFSPGIVSGGVPVGDDGFDSLLALQFRTIISVDGAIPDLDRARTRGLRYIHLPITYGGFDQHRLLEISRALRDLEPNGAIYIHCHHGKHRSAAAAAAACVALGRLSNDQAVARMTVAGTSTHYTGLYRAAQAAAPVSAAQLDSVRGTFPERTEPAGLVGVMGELDELMQRLDDDRRDGWRWDAASRTPWPGIDASRMHERLRWVQGRAAELNKGDDFLNRNRNTLARAEALDQLLEQLGRPAAGKLALQPDTARQLDAAVVALAASCKDCHVHHRD